MRAHNCAAVQQLQRAAAERKQKRVFTARYIKKCENDLLIGVVQVFIVIGPAVNLGGCGVTLNDQAILLVEHLILGVWCHP